MTILPPIPTNAPKATIHGFAEQVAERLGFGPGDSMEPLVARLGGRVEYRAPIISQNRLPESIVVETPHKFTIYVASITSPERDRFTIAHELGHLFLHFPLVAQQHPGAVMAATRWVDETDKVQQRAEWEANWFAAAFLMPGSKFRAAFAECSGNLPRLASRFGVSSPAAEIRAKTLSLV